MFHGIGFVGQVEEHFVVPTCMLEDTMDYSSFYCLC